MFKSFSAREIIIIGKILNHTSAFRQLMLIDIIKGTILGVVMWFALLISSNLISFALGEDLLGTATVIITPIIALVFSWYYLDNEDITAKISEGIRLGLLWLILNLGMDFLLIAFIFGTGFDYFLNWYLWIGYIEIIISCLMVGYFISKTKKRWLRE